MNKDTKKTTIDLGNMHGFFFYDDYLKINVPEDDEPIADEDVELRAAFGAGYAIPSEAGNAAIRLLARNEGIFIDPVYTGKAFGEFLKMAEEGALEGEENIIFLHTGGAGGLFAIDV